MPHDIATIAAVGGFLICIGAALVLALRSSTRKRNAHRAATAQRKTASKL